MEFIERKLYKDKFGIYSIVNKVNGKTYVGQTGESFLRRFLHHNWKLKDDSHDNQHLQNAWNRYGDECFDFIVLEVVYDKTLLDDLEIEYINLYRNLQLNYNIIDGGNYSRRGIPMSDHAKKLVGQKNKVHMLGKKHSDETKKKMSEVRTGHEYTRYRKTNVLTDELVVEIKISLISGKKATDIAKELDIDYKHINNIISNNTWSNIVVDGWDEFINSRKTYTRLSTKDHQEIYRLHIEEGYTKYQLAEIYNKGVKMIERIFLNQRKQTI